MSSKISVDEVASILKKHKLDPAVLREVVEEINEVVESKEAEKEVSGPKPKQQYALLVSDPSGKVPAGLTGWVVQLPEADAPHTILERIKRGAHDFNASKRGRMLPVKTIGEACESVTRKFFKANNVHVKTKTPVYVITTDNTLGEAPSA